LATKQFFIGFYSDHTAEICVDCYSFFERARFNNKSAAENYQGFWIGLDVTAGSIFIKSVYELTNVLLDDENVIL
jgi:hypothetical protein